MPSADGGSADSRGLFSGGHLHGQLLPRNYDNKGRSWLVALSEERNRLDCTRKFHLPRPVSTGWRARLFLPPTRPPVADEVLHQRTSIGCGLGHVQLAVAADACPLEHAMRSTGGARSGAGRERRLSPFPSCTRPCLCVVVKGGGRRTRREQHRSPTPMESQSTLVGFSAAGTCTGSF